MVDFFLRLVLFTHTLVRLWRRDPDFRALVVSVFFTLLAGTIFYSVQEGWSLVDALYFSVTTLTTVGLGDLSPTTTVGKLFTVVYIFTGLGLIAGFVTTIGTETLSRRTRRQRNDAVQEDSEAT
jgi:voltage-gated potassium channel